MAYAKTIVCLANSRKHLGRCVAGKEYSDDGFGAWVRPVSARSGQEISEEDRRYQNGTRAGLLDIISLPMIAPEPKDYQVENHQIDSDLYWEKLGELTWEDLPDAVDTVNGPLWFDGDSSYNGLNDRVPVDRAAAVKSSLLLVTPSNLRMKVGLEGGVQAPAKRKVRAQFHLGRTEYWLAVTDPNAEQEYLKRDNGTYDIDGALLCISLGEPFGAHAYKLVATVITPD